MFWPIDALFAMLQYRAQNHSIRSGLLMSPLLRLCSYFLRLLEPDTCNEVAWYLQEGVMIGSPLAWLFSLLCYGWSGVAQACLLLKQVDLVIGHSTVLLLIMCAYCHLLFTGIIIKDRQFLFWKRDFPIENEILEIISIFSLSIFDDALSWYLLNCYCHYSDFH